MTLKIRTPTARCEELTICRAALISVANRVSALPDQGELKSGWLHWRWPGLGKSWPIMDFGPVAPIEAGGKANRRSAARS
jgi:hypothetical protein